MHNDCEHGSTSEYKPAEGCQCRMCKQENVEVALWESSCGGYEDYYYRCKSCGYGWWVEGADA